MLSYVQCPFHALTGLYCPLCGSTRAVLALLHGDVLLAIRCNLALVAAVMWTAAVAVKGRLGTPQEPVGQRFSLAGCCNWALLAVVAIFTVVRNLPGVWWLRP